MRLLSVEAAQGAAVAGVEVDHVARLVETAAAARPAGAGERAAQVVAEAIERRAVGGGRGTDGAAAEHVVGDRVRLRAPGLARRAVAGWVGEVGAGGAHAAPR